MSLNAQSLEPRLCELIVHPRGKRDRYCDYFANSRNITRIHRAYCIANPGKFKGYGENCWGLTASYTPGGYLANLPFI